MMNDIVENYSTVLNRIRLAEQKYHRQPYSVSCLAVSKQFSVDSLRPLIDVGQRAFGENYLQEALPKISALRDKNVEWHFIGRIQSRKCQEIAEHFSWLHTLYREKEAEKLARARPTDMAPLQVCIQVAVAPEDKHAGLAPEAAYAFASKLTHYKTLQLRGLMVLPPNTSDFHQQRHYFKLVKTLGMQLISAGIHIDTFSMGMTNDLEAAVAEGTTLVRIGQGIFGARHIQYNNSK